MKQRTLALLLAVCLVMGIPAFAANGDKMLTRDSEDGFGFPFESICSFGDTLYMLSYDNVFHTYSPTDDTMHKYAWDAETQRLFKGVEADDDTLYLNILCHFTWREGLYVLAETRYFYEGVEKVELCEVVLNDGSATLKPVCEVDWLPLTDSEGYIQINTCVTVGDVLCLNAYMGSMVLCLMPLDGSDLTVTSHTFAELCAFEDKLIIAETEYKNGFETTFTAMNPVTGETAVANVKYKSDKQPSGFVYDGETGNMLFTEDGSVVSFDILSKNPSREVIAPIPVAPDINSNGMSACLLDSGAYAAAGYMGVALRQVKGREQAEGKLVIASHFLTDSLNNALLAFGNLYPGIEITTTRAENVLNDLLTRSDAVDIYFLSSYNPQDTSLAAVLKRGWGLELDSSDIIKEYFAGMYPEFAGAFMYEGKPIAVPYEAEAFGVGINTGALNMLGLTLDDVPKDWAGFFGFIASLSENDVVPVLGEDARRGFSYNALNLMLNDYCLEMDYGNLDSFDTDEFRSILRAYESIDFDAMENFDSWDTYNGNMLISEYMFAGVNGDTFPDDGYEYFPLRLSVTPDKGAYMPLNARAAFINPSSKSAQTAIEFLEFATKYTDDKSLAMMNAEYGEPVLDEKVYASETARQDSQIEALRASYAEAADSEKAALNERLEAAIDLRERMEDWYWTVSPESLELYKSRDENVVMNMPTITFEVNFANALDRYIDGADDMNAFIAEIENLTRMARLENS